MKITKSDLLEHASRFDFHYGNCPTDIVRVEKVLRRCLGDYWVIKWGGGRWSKKDQLFILGNAGSDITGEFIEDTKFTFEEAYTLAGSVNLIQEHEKRMK